MRKTKKKPARKSKSRKASGILATSRKTQISHGFTNLDGWEKNVEIFARIYQDRMIEDLLKAVPFWSWLNQQNKPSRSEQVTWTAPLVRIVFGGLNPLSIAGSLSNGGRYNVGAAQQTSFEQLSGIQMQAALYAGDSQECSTAEAGPPSENMEIYELSPRSKLQLWDMEKIFDLYSWPNLRSLVECEPFNKAWKLQKSPAISQLLGTFLRQTGGDGILSKSVKHQGGNVITVFLKDDAQAQKIFSTKQMPNHRP